MQRSVFLTRLLEATNAHDLERIVDCFSPDYVNTTPCHPARGFTGTDQVRRNWSAILAGVPDLVATVVAESTTGDQVWSEWEMEGTRRDNTAHLMRGVMIFDVDGERARSCRFYLEPVVADQQTADGFVSTVTAGGSP
jgi:ketosteroid isomerase-like protein